MQADTPCPQHFEAILQAADWRSIHTCDTVSLAALLIYLTQDLSSACAVYERYIAQTSGVVEERLYMSQVKLIYRHSSLQKAYKPGLLRGVLESALAKFPHNSIFLSLYFYNVRIAVASEHTEW